MTAKVILPKSDRIKVTRNKTTTYEDMELVCEGIRKHYEDRETGALIIHALHIMYFTGLRPQEVYALSKYNVDTKRRIIAVKSSVGSSSTGSGVIVHTKTPQSERDVYYPADLDEVFAELMAGGHDYLFMTKKGLLNGNKTSAIINRCRPVDFRQYNLRHQFSSDLIEKGVDVRTVQELMGHADPQMSINYARSREETKRKAIDSRFDRK